MTNDVDLQFVSNKRLMKLKMLPYLRWLGTQIAILRCWILDTHPMKWMIDLTLYLLLVSSALFTIRINLYHNQ